MNTTSPSKPLVSIVLPTFNRAEMLRRALGSIVQQTLQNIEVIVVDDCSLDVNAVRLVIDGFSDQRITIIRHDSNKGGAAARNTGILACKGEYVAFLDDDDEWRRDKLEKQVDLFQKSQAGDLGVVYSGFTYVSKEGDAHLEIEPGSRGNVSVNMLSHCILGSATPLIKRVILSQTGSFDETLPSCQDWDMWIRLSQQCSFDFVSGSLAYSFVHGDQISGSLEKK